MKIPEEVARIEKALAARGIPVAALCRKAAVARSTWDRWGRATTQPNMRTWAQVQAAADKLLADPAPPAEEDAA